MSPGNNVRSYFDKVALENGGFYDKKNSLAYLAQAWVRKQVLSQIDFIPKTITDVGSGRGDFTLDLAKKFKKSEIIGADFSSAMMNIAGKNCQEKTNVSFKLADLSYLPFSEKQFELSVCLNTLHLLPRESFLAAIRELARITSRLLIIELKNEKNIYTFFKKIKERLNTKGALTTFVASKEVADILSQNNFRLEQKKNIFFLPWLSPIIVLKFRRLDSTQK